MFRFARVVKLVYTYVSGRNEYIGTDYSGVSFLQGQLVSFEHFAPLSLRILESFCHFDST
jgi:hypothetical protein